MEGTCLASLSTPDEKVTNAAGENGTLWRGGEPQDAEPVLAAHLSSCRSLPLFLRIT